MLSQHIHRVHLYLAMRRCAALPAGARSHSGSDGADTPPCLLSAVTLNQRSQALATDGAEEVHLCLKQGTAI